MQHFNLALLGFGNVGKALARLLLQKETQLRDEFDLTFAVTAIGTGNHGFAIDAGGLDLEKAIITEDLSKISTTLDIRDPYDFIRRSGADVLFEVTPVNYQTGQPAVDFLRTALSEGMHAITANKGPVVHAHRELTRMAELKGKKFLFESTVMDGAPIFSLFREALPAAQLLSFRGVLNSTTNMILTRMEEGESFEAAVAYAQEIGIAETDPSGDIDGWDAAVKVAALITVLMGVSFKPSDVDRCGIREITGDDIARASQEGKRWKLVCSARRDGETVLARVTPEMVGRDSPLYAVERTSSIVQFETDVLGQLSVVEGNPGPHTTAYGLLADFLYAVKISGKKVSV
jgi:homoserine dehydrogenase